MKLLKEWSNTPGLSKMALAKKYTSLGFFDNAYPQAYSTITNWLKPEFASKIRVSYEAMSTDRDQ